MKTMFEFSTGFLCPQCGRGFAMMCTLKRHIKTTHTNVKPFACKNCPLKFKTKCSVNAHMNMVHDNTNTKCKCDLCGAILMSPYSLNRHMSKNLKQNFEYLFSEWIINEP